MLYLGSAFASGLRFLVSCCRPSSDYEFCYRAPLPIQVDMYTMTSEVMADAINFMWKGWVLTRSGAPNWFDWPSNRSARKYFILSKSL